MAALYIVAAWLIMQVAGVLIDLGNLPVWVGPIILPLLVIGFPIAIALSWFYEITPEGVSRERDVEPGATATHVAGRRLDFIVISLLCAAVILFAYDKWWIGPPPEKSIAVLPFTNLSGDPEQEYFSDGISEELLHLLAQIQDVRVPARTSSFYFKDRNEPVADIAAALNVAHVLEGSIRRSGDRIRITAQLIKADDGYHVWSQTYDREIGDIFAIQDEIAANISDSLKLHLGLAGDGTELPRVIRAANIQAYDAYLKGKQLFQQREVRSAIDEFERALRIDDDFAPAHAQLAVATAFLGLGGNLSLDEIAETANPHLERAEALAPNLAEVHAGRALLADLEGDYEAEIEHLREALELNPSYGDAMNWLQIALVNLGRYEEHDAFMEQMLTADPLDYVVRFNYAEWLCEKGRIDEARVLADQVLAQDSRWGNWIHASILIFYEGQLAEGLSHALQMSHFWWASRVLAWVGEYDEARRIYPDGSHWVDAEEGDWDEAIRETKDQLKLTPDSIDALTIAGSVMVQAGRPQEALPLLERALDKAPEGRPMATDLGLRATIWLAEARRQTGDEDGAQAAARIARADLAALRASGRDNANLWLVEAMLAAFENDTERVIASLEKAMKLGLRDTNFHFSTSSFAHLRGEPRFVALLEELEGLIAAEHKDVLQLVCFNNPVPDEWQPLPETCEGVVERSL
jgi:TolB-like protein/Tfp pilus assembly protein PilF